MTEVFKNFIHKTKAADGSWETLYPRTTAANVITTDQAKFVSTAQVTQWNAKAEVAQVNNALTEAKGYTDKAIENLIDSAPEQLNTLKELAEAIQLTDSELDGLLGVVGNKATKEELEAHVFDEASHVSRTDRETWNAKASKAVATTTTDGLMSIADKSKLDGIARNANYYVLPTASNATTGGVKVGENVGIEGGVISVANASTDVKGVVQLSNTLTSTSTVQALTAAQGKVLSDALSLKANAADIKPSLVSTVEPAGVPTGTLWMEVVK